jgi:hypothetical protein
VFADSRPQIDYPGAGFEQIYVGVILLINARFREKCPDVLGYPDVHGLQTATAELPGGTLDVAAPVVATAARG